MCQNPREAKQEASIQCGTQLRTCAACVCRLPLPLSSHYSRHPHAPLLPSSSHPASSAFCGHFLSLHIASFSWCGATDSVLIYSYFWVLQLVSCEDPSWSFIYPGVGFWNWIERFQSIEARATLASIHTWMAKLHFIQILQKYVFIRT